MTAYIDPVQDSCWGYAIVTMVEFEFYGTKCITFPWHGTG
jgi:hypothetical protein